MLPDTLVAADGNAGVGVSDSTAAGSALRFFFSGLDGMLRGDVEAEVVAGGGGRGGGREGGKVSLLKGCRVDIPS